MRPSDMRHAVHLRLLLAVAALGAQLCLGSGQALAQREWLGTSTTTMPLLSGCSQPLSSGVTPLASDCLWILNVAVGVRSCEPACLCAPKGTLPVTATDALVCLRVATGANVALQCPCNGNSTTTTLGDPLAAGRELYDSVCSGCHRAGNYDRSGFAPDLAGKGSLVVNNLGSIDSAMSSIFLSNQEVSDVAAFLNSL